MIGMLRMKTNKIMAVILEKSEDGKTPSVAKKDFEPALKKQCKTYKAFYYDEYLKDESCKFKITPGKSLKDLQADVHLMAEEFKPDIIFFNIIKDEFNTKLLNELKRHYTTINWFSDDEWRWHNFGRDYCWNFTYVITTSSHAFKNYKAIGYNNVLLHSWGSSKFIKKIKKNKMYVFDVMFIGGWSKEREELITYLKDNDINVECYGSGWANGSISQDDMEKYIYRSKINLNLSNSTFTLNDKIVSFGLKIYLKSKILTYFLALGYLWLKKDTKKDKFHKEFHNKIRYFKTRAAIKTSEQVKARHFEIPAFGGFQLSYSCSDIEYIFIDEKENIVLFIDKEDCLKKIKYYLIHDKEREEIAMRGWEYCKEYYNYDSIFGSIIKEVSQK